jgi:hypothetical protein
MMKVFLILFVAPLRRMVARREKMRLRLFILCENSLGKFSGTVKALRDFRRSGFWWGTAPVRNRPWSSAPCLAAVFPS